MPDETAIADPNVTVEPSTTAGAEPSASSEPSTPVESWAKNWLKSDGSFDHSVFDKAPDEIKPLAKDVGRYKTVDEFLKGARERDALLGKKGIFDPLPTNATKEAIEERSSLLRKAVGAPDKPEGYAIKKPDGVPDSMWDADFAKQAAELAHKHAASPALLNDLAQAQLAATQKAQQAFTQQKTDWVAGQDKLFRDTAAKEGLDFAKAKDLVDRAGRKLGIDPKNPVMESASVLLALMRAGKMMSEDTLVTGGTRGTGIQPNMTPEKAEASFLDIMHNKDNPEYAVYWNHDKKQNSVKVEEVRARVRKLQELAHKKV